LALVRKKPVV